MEKKIMRLMFVLMFCAVIIGAAKVARSEDNVSTWTKTDIGLELVTVGLLAVDWSQTLWLSGNRSYQVHSTGVTGNTGWASTTKYTYEENNPLLGKHPSRGTVNAYFPLCIVGHAVVAHYLPSAVKALGGSDSMAKYSRTVWQSVWIGIEGYAVGTNISAGVKMSF